MSITAIVPVAVLVLGLLLWLLSSSAKASEAGSLCFFAGVFVLTLRLAGETLRIGGG